MYHDPNVRKKALNMINNLETETLIQLLSNADQTKMPKTEFQMLREEMAKQEEMEHRTMNPEVPSYVDNEREVAQRSIPTEKTDRAQYLSGYAPKITDNRPQREYLTLDEDEIESTGHRPFEVKSPVVSRESSRRRDYLKDDVNSGEDEGQGHSVAYVSGGSEL